MFPSLPPNRDRELPDGHDGRFHRCQQTVAGSFRFLLTGLGDLCYPPACVLCHGPLGIDDEAWGAEPSTAEGPGSICGGCRATLVMTAAEASCDRCGRPQPSVSDSPPAMPDGGLGRLELQLCAWCRKQPGAVERMVALGMYRDVMREAVVAAKRLSFQPLALALGEMLGHRVRRVWDSTPIGAVTYIPSHWIRRCGRGGCPAQLLAHQVGRVLQIPVLPILRATRQTAKQGTLGDTSRRSNVSGAFRAKKGYALSSPRVLVVDDVWTTGATLQEAAAVIHQGYGAEVFAAVVARAIGTHAG